MCGISGYFSTSISRVELAKHLETMTSAISRRGPDGQHTWHASSLNLGLGHRRLSIIDLSDSAQQPMHSANNRYVITYNGVIYNYLELKNELINLGINFKTSSDSEVLLEAISHWGIKTALRKVRGMFALGLFDRREKIIYLARDRFGQKPLYYTCRQNLLAFASELKAFKNLPGFSPSIDPNALDSFFRYNHIAGTRSIFKEIKKVEKGSILSFKLSEQKCHPFFQEKFWDLKEVWNNRTHFIGNQFDAEQSLLELLNKIVNEQKRSDVPIGCFLSSGIDSTVISKILQLQSIGPIKTFSIGFPDDDFDESSGAKFYAKQIGSEHHEFKFSDTDLTKLIPECMYAYDEPFADTSQLPTMLLSKHARAKVKVCLSGDGADELFAGYNRHMLIPNLMSLQRTLPGKILNLVAKFLNRIPYSRLNSITKLVGELMQDTGVPRHLATKLHKLSWALSQNSPEKIHESLMNEWKEQKTPAGIFCYQPVFYADSETSALRSLLLNDLNSYLSDGILTKVDRAAMHYGLETRMPYLDERLVEFSFSLPDDFLVQKNQQKIILKRLQSKLFPTLWQHNSKTGFSPPLGRWLTGGLRSWTEESLNSNVMAKAGLDPLLIKKKWEEFLRGKYDWTFSIWSLVVFSNWYRQFNQD